MDKSRTMDKNKSMDKNRLMDRNLGFTDLSHEKLSFSTKTRVGRVLLLPAAGCTRCI
jgi:hypothetical protein